MLSDWITFEGRVVPMQWGESLYTVLPLPPDVAALLSDQGARRVEIELNDHPFNMALTKAPVMDDVFVYTGKQVLATAEIEPGAPIEVRVRKVDADLVEVPEDVALALRQQQVTAAWDALPPGKRRAALHQINSAKRVQTRAARIARLIAELH